MLVGSEAGWEVVDDWRRVPLSAAAGDGDNPASPELHLANLEGLPRPIDDAVWAGPRDADDPSDVLESLVGKFHLRVATATETGLRVPQAGAVHAVLAHWTTESTEPATVVMPTGTGKTETMLALFASERPRRLLVVVPSQNLRTHIAEKFERLGVLPSLGVVEPGVRLPVVGRIEHRFESGASMRASVEADQRIVATPEALHASSETVVGGLVSRCSHLFVDEAHHVPARTWSTIRGMFAGKHVVQFTATPYREDGKRLGGRIAYSYPLRAAQARGYFQKIDYVAVAALENSDEAVAQAAVDRLNRDRANGFDHLIMARVGRIGRARDDVLPIYQALAPECEPVVLHSDLNLTDRRAALESISTRASRIVVCVNMLGEGFDFPELKIAAVHDAHRSLGPTLQFIGRFARSRADLGPAAAIVGKPEPGYDPRLQALYAEGNDWDAVLNVVAEGAVDHVQAEDEFELGFGAAQNDIAVQVLRPKMSTVVYRTEVASNGSRSGSRACSRPRGGWFGLQTLKRKESESPGWSSSDGRVSDGPTVKSVEDRCVLTCMSCTGSEVNGAYCFINSSDLESLHENLAICGVWRFRASGLRGDSGLPGLSPMCCRPVPTNIGSH